MPEKTYYDYGLDPIIAVDIETKDPLILSKGPGVYRRDGHICGVSFSNGDLSEYYPINHPGLNNEEITKNYNFIKDQLLKSNRKVFANGMYDLDWLINFEGLKVNGNYDDIQIAEPLIDEYRKSYSLNSLSQLYLNDEKKKSGIDIYAAEQGWVLEGKPGIGHLWKMPAEIVELYASEDARLTINIFKKQLDILKAQNLYDLYDLEMRLFPMLLQMKKIGVKLDTKKLYKTETILIELSKTLQNELNEIAQFEVNPNSAKDLEALFLKNNIKVTYNDLTEKMTNKGKTIGNPSFSKEVLLSINSPIAKKILELRHIKTLLSLFIQPYPTFLVNNRLHSQFNQLRSDEYGTVSGRFSSSNPNLQQVSAKNEEDYISDSLAKSEILNGQIIRKLFIPEDNCKWLKYDWSQIEYRIIAHYAIGEGADEIRRRYNENPDTDYHTELGDMVGIKDRKRIKNLNFASVYGMGINTMAKKFNIDITEASEVYTMYHDKVPFVKETGKRIGLKAKRVGFIFTLLNRRARLIDSSKSYVMFNRLVQGSAADLMKKAMVDSYEAGIFNSLFPHLTVHDELDISMPETKEGIDAAKSLKYIMENCIKIRVPIKVEVEIGPNWGELKKFEEII